VCAKVRLVKGRITLYNGTYPEKPFGEVSAMKKIILIPDSFKGTLSAMDVCRIMAAQIERHAPSAQVVSIPVADGGEGSVDCLLTALGGERIAVPVAGVFGEPMEGFFGLLPGGETAVIEMACCAGLPLAAGRLDPLRATTYGVGQLMVAAAQRGAKHILLGLGGSASHDGGCGAAAACGVRFLDAAGEAFVPIGGMLMRIADIDVSGLDAALAGVRITAMCDIDNPMFGPAGAASVFAPQKGANARMVRFLDAGTRHLSGVFREKLGLDLSSMPGGGAAGAMGAGMCALLGASLRPGIETVLDTVDFDSQLAGAGLVLTGEGRLDSQSLGGKVVIGVARRARARGVPVIALVGGLGEGWRGAYAEGVTAMLSINTRPMTLEEAGHHAEENLAATTENLLRILGI